MQTAALRFRRTVLASFGAMLVAAGTAWAADLGPARPPVIEAPPTSPSWTYRFTPYGWLTSLDGTQTVRGRSVKVDASFIDIVEKSDTLVGLMGDFEARNGRFALYGDLVWSSIGFERNDVTGVQIGSSGSPGHPREMVAARTQCTP